MTGFGRTGKIFAIEHEDVVPDMIVLGKGLSGGYLPLAMTVVTEEIFSRFDGSVAEGRALAYGHSYTGNPVGCAAAKASLEVFVSENVLEALQPKIGQIRAELEPLKTLTGIKEIRQCGFIAGIEVTSSRLAVDICLAARSRGLLTRPIRNVIVLMPPLCITHSELSIAVAAIRDSIVELSAKAHA
jgi:adenosylmethionine-8-amino-7-oxononanoate aminotransferase